MTPLPRAVIVDALPTYHPIFATTAPSQLSLIDSTWCKGRWRRWSQYLTAVLRYAQPGDPLTPTISKYALTALGWTHRPTPSRQR